MTSGQVSGTVLLRMLQTGRLWLGKHRDFLNDQNVYPVPDGDTGTNMWLTLSAAWQAASAASSEAGAGELWHAAAQGALAGSRGNSGVILSQFLRGMSESMGCCPALDGATLRQALQMGSDWAYAAVHDPQEGTILTVARDVAISAQALADDAAVGVVLQHVLPAAQASVARTPELLSVLKQAGVVDAGGLGLTYFLSGLLKGLQGEEVEIGAWADTAVNSGAAEPRFVAIPELVHGFDVQFLAHQPRLPLAEMRTAVNSMGEYGLVEGTPELVKVHVHVQDPGPVLSWGCSVGFLTDVIVENLDAMAAVKQEGRPDDHEDIPEEGRVRVLQAAAAAEHAVVAVSSGSGFSKLFASLGVNCVIECPDTINPSVQQFVEAVAQVGGDHVVVLPNSVNAVAAACAARETFPPDRVAVIHTPFILNGVTAMYAFEQALSWTDLVVAMTAQAQALLFGSVARATRAVEGSLSRVVAGDFVAMGQAQTVIGGGSQLVDAVRQLLAGFLLPALAQAEAADFSFLTLYKGVDLAPADQDAVAAVLCAQLPDFEIEWVESRQKHYWLLIAAE